jgi:hypothetical protein
MTNTVGGLVPTPPNDATKFLNGAGVFSTPVSSGAILSASKTITSAQLLHLQATPVVDVVPGVVGKAIIPLAISLNGIYKTVAYTDSGFGLTFLIYYHGNIAAGEVFVAPCADTVFSTYNCFETVCNDQQPYGASSLFVGAGLDISIGGGVHELINGNGTLVITIHYLLLDGVV